MFGGDEPGLQALDKQPVKHGSIGFRSIIVAVFWAVSYCHSASAIPITDTVVVGDKEWAQVDLFRAINWVNTNALCPGGVCGSGTINDYDMAGWTWATANDVNELFNHYIGAPELGPGPDGYLDYSAAWGYDFVTDGWRSTRLAGIPESIASYLYGVTATNGCTGGPCTALMIAYQHGVHGAFTDRAGNYGYNPGSVGGWFFRKPESVPVPPTIVLTLLGLFAVTGHLVARNRNK